MNPQLATSDELKFLLQLADIFTSHLNLMTIEGQQSRIKKCRQRRNSIQDLCADSVQFTEGATAEIELPGKPPNCLSRESV